MSFDFTTHYDRAGHDSEAVEGVGRDPFAPTAPKPGFDPIPMWVADMGFATAPTVIEAITRRLEHPIFGYFMPSDEYLGAICDWHRTRKGHEITPDEIGYEHGVLGGVMSALGVFCTAGDKVLVHSPTYNGFTGVIGGAGYDLVGSPLIRDKEGVWRMDYEDMERRIVKDHIHAAILCSPHNPCGRVWERWELERAYEIFERHGVYVVADEIWSDLLLDGARHTPAQTVSPWARDHTVALYAPTKTFNLAGLVGSYHVICDPWLRDRVSREEAWTHYNQQNVLSMHALIGAFSDEGAAWADELCAQLSENARWACDYIDAHWPGVSVARPQGTYLLLVDCEAWCAEHGVGNDEIVRRAWDVGVAWHDGRIFGSPWCLRVNFALPLDQLQEAFDRLDKYVFV